MQHPKANKLQYREIVSFIEAIQKKNSNRRSLTALLSSIKRYYDYLIEIGKRTDHPCRSLHIKSQPTRDIQIQDLFTPEELESLLLRVNRYPAIANRNLVILSLLIYQGLTSREIVSLEQQHIDLDSATVYVKASGRLDRRTLELVPKQIRFLDKYMNKDRKKLFGRFRTSQLLATLRGSEVTVDDVHSVIVPLKPLFRSRDLSPQTIRMSVIVNWLNEKRLPLEQVQLMAGHKWPSTTEKYRRGDLEEQRRLINLFHPMG